MPKSYPTYSQFIAGHTTSWLHHRDEPLPHIFTSDYPLICISHPQTRNPNAECRVDADQSIFDR